MNNQKIPIVAVLGHVDHGKSSLLDAIRNSDIVENEVGEITQHIGAYMIKKGDRNITFIDTPGHASFQETRNISLKAADVAILLVSCDDGWKEQTSDAYKSIKEKNIPFIIAFSKCDLQNTNIEKLKKEILQKGILLDGLGGDTPWVQISSKTKEGVDDFVDFILLFFDTLEKKEVEIDGVVIDTEIDDRSGIAATIIIKNSTLKAGDFVVSGDAVAPTRIMLSHDLEQIKEVNESMPVRLIGFSKSPIAGDEIKIFKKKKDVEKYLKNKIVDEKKSINKKNINSKDLEKIGIIIKADTSGILTASKKELEKYKKFTVVNSGLGSVTQKDLDFANLSGNTHILGFGVKIPKDVLSFAKTNKIIIKKINTVYQIDDWIKDLQTKNDIIDEDEISGAGEIIKLFSKKGNVVVCGVKITSGSFVQGEECVLSRNNKKLQKFIIQSIQQEKKEETKVTGIGVCFAMSVKTDIDFEIGDEIISCNK